MTNQEILYFKKLTEIRSNGADLLGQRFLRGMWDSLVKKYSDQAHFIYELLQNADDVGAKSARFILEKGQLIFAHNGTRLFSVSNPETEDEDTDLGILGDINAITSVANSNKTEASIGKFGVGFKAVFQYTASPRIYGPNLRFRIDRYIVPTMIDEDFPGRHADETLFVFPFDRDDMSETNAYSDISEKLRALSYPILFLSQLQDITFEFADTIGLYGKRCRKTVTFGETTAQYIILTQNNGNELYDESLWLFSRKDSSGRIYSCGFFTDENGKLRPVNEPAFCFFPTKEVTGLNFIVHAPFLLTDNREGIRAGVAHNTEMINLLSQLSADAFVYLRDIGIKSGMKLIDDSIVSIVPVNEENFGEASDKRKVSFKPFYTAIKNKFSTEAIIPSESSYVKSSNAYWAAVPQLVSLFSNAHLEDITKNKSAEWVFISLGRDGVQRNNSILCRYIDSIIKTSINEDHILNGRFTYNPKTNSYIKDINGITAALIEKQPVEWLHKFYKWLSETKHRTEEVSDKPIFIDQNYKAIAAYDANEQPMLFLPTQGVTGYPTVYPKLLQDAETVKFLNAIGVKEPSIRDQIYKKILPQYQSNEVIDTNPHFMLFFKYYRQCPPEDIDEFIDSIRECKFITYYKENDPQPYHGMADELYYPSEDLKAYFSTKPGIRFVALDEYKKLVGIFLEKALTSFLMELGVHKEAKLEKVEIEWDEARKRSLPFPRSTGALRWAETRIDGCQEIITDITAHQNAVESVALWDQLLQIINDRCNSWHSLSSLLMGECHYYYYTDRTQSFTSSDVILLRTSAWLIDENGNFMPAQQVSVQSLSKSYDTKSEAVNELIKFLGIQAESKQEDEDSDEEDDSYLSDKQREQISLAKRLEEEGITEEDIEELRSIKRIREERAKASESHLINPEEGDSQTTVDSGDDEDTYLSDDYDEDVENAKNDEEDNHPVSHQAAHKKLSKATSRVVRDIVDRTQDKPSADFNPSLYDSDDEDEDEYIRPTVDYSKKIERAKQKSAGEISRIEYYESLQQKAIDAKKYSYGWFNALLEMESLSNIDSNLNSREVSISFAHVEREPGTQRTLVLKHPNRYIPQFMEDLADIPLVLSIGDKTKTVAIEVANIKSYTLRVKLKTNTEIGGIDLSQVTEARIDAQSPIFLLEELRKQFSELGFDDDYDMQANLCENIEFVFGPPGTGKTTYLAKNVLVPLMKQKQDLKVLVLTPTNKAADVLVNRITEVMGEDVSYHNWLVRFGATHDEVIEQSPVYRDKTFDIRTLSRNVTVTTIARFPYDFFMPSGARIFLKGINWDYIVIDEASMIPIANIVYPLYKKTPKKFIIAGDPFQIEPITAVDLWKNENIYTMVHLDSFVKPETVPHDYKITLLTTQYRSTPVIGDVFSKFAYGGILKHHRPAESRLPLNIESILPVKSLNLVKFPVSKYESIYRSKRLQRSSSYQIYSALFTFEFVSYLAKSISAANAGIDLRIGVIAPYRAQADLIDKLMASVELPDGVDVQVGTIHGFQGDECDIIFAVFNTPPSISASKEMFLNKRNIINVSISRAKDYLFVIMPDDNTDNIDNLSLVKRVEYLLKSSDDCAEFATQDIEQVIFGNAHYLEENTFSTGHQSVNIYNLPEKRYEIRSEDAAVDIQIHQNKAVSKKDNVKENEPKPATIIPQLANEIDIAEDTVAFSWLEAKTRICPCDGNGLTVMAVPVTKKNGDRKKLNMFVCAKCGRRFIVKGSLPKSIQLSDYKVIEQTCDVNTNTPTQSGKAMTPANKPSSREVVYNALYGKGEIIKYYSSPTYGPMIKVRFASCEKDFIEKKAFESKALVRV